MFCLLTTSRCKLLNTPSDGDMNPPFAWTTLAFKRLQERVNTNQAKNTKQNRLTSQQRGPFRETYYTRPIHRTTACKLTASTLQKKPKLNDDGVKNKQQLTILSLKSAAIFESAFSSATDNTAVTVPKKKLHKKWRKNKLGQKKKKKKKKTKNF
jgi:hypothetical protein